MKIECIENPAPAANDDKPVEQWEEKQRPIHNEEIITHCFIVPYA